MAKMITRIEPPLEVFTPKGNGLAYFLVDYSYEMDLMWVVFLDSNGECWTYRNRDIRLQSNITHGRGHPSPFYDPNAVSFKPNGVCR